VATAAFAASTLGMLLRVEPIASWYYALAWWPFIFALDALTLALRGDSLISRNPRGFLVLSLISVPFWLIFEAWNLVMKNWYYVGADPLWVARWVGYTVCFATVLPAIFEAAALVAATGSFERVRVRPIRVGPWLYVWFWAMGGTLLLLPLLAPKYGFPGIWLGFIFLLEPFNHRFAAKSLLRQWEEGSLRTVCRLLAGGLICGLAWEAFNTHALTKWIYSVPFFEGLKLFEMPLAGFLGFPPFAVECYVMIQFLGIFRLSAVPRAVGWGASLAVGLGSLGMFHLLDAHTVNSLQPRVSHLHELAPQEAALLQRAGVDRMDLWVEGPGGLKGRRGELLAHGLSREALERWEGLAMMATLKGMGTENLKLMLAAGVGSPGDLGRQDPEELGERMREIHTSTGWGRQPPRDAQVRMWVREAKALEKRPDTRLCQ
jgi:hypothetical protein